MGACSVSLYTLLVFRVFVLFDFFLLFLADLG